MTFIERESYAHKAAKSIVCGWLREQAAVVGYDEYAALSPLWWRVNRDGPEWGVLLEYPFAEKEGRMVGRCPAWDEVIGVTSPSFDQCIRSSYNVLAVADIAIQHKGEIAAVVEITWKNSLSSEKKALYKRLRVDQIIEVDAHWVLSQIEKPTALKYRDLFDATEVTP